MYGEKTWLSSATPNWICLNPCREIYLQDGQATILLSLLTSSVWPSSRWTTAWTWILGLSLHLPPETLSSAIENPVSARAVTEMSVSQSFRHLERASHCQSPSSTLSPNTTAFYCPKHRSTEVAGADSDSFYSSVLKCHPVQSRRTWRCPGN